MQIYTCDEIFWQDECLKLINTGVKHNIKTLKA